jgi:hypothetical protein
MPVGCIKMPVGVHIGLVTLLCSYQHMGISVWFTRASLDLLTQMLYCIWWRRHTQWVWVRNVTGIYCNCIMVRSVGQIVPGQAGNWGGITSLSCGDVHDQPLSEWD